MRITKKSETMIIEGTVSEIREMFGQAGFALSADIDPQTLTVTDDHRYHSTGRIGNYGEHEKVDVRTGRRGVYMSAMAIGFVKGAYVTDSGNIEYEHPWDNPLQGCRF